MYRPNFLYFDYLFEVIFMFFAKLNYFSFKSIRELLDSNDYLYFFRSEENTFKSESRLYFYLYWSKDKNSILEKLNSVKERYPDEKFISNFIQDDPSPTPELPF